MNFTMSVQERIAQLEKDNEVLTSNWVEAVRRAQFAEARLATRERQLRRLLDFQPEVPPNTEGSDSTEVFP